MNLAQLTAMTEDQSREYLEKIRWPEGACCPHCSSKEVTKLEGKSTTPGTYKCKAKECRKKFTVRVGTIFERSHIELRHWVMAFHLMCSSKKGISAHQIHRSLGVTYKTAWFMCHRIRHAMEQGSLTLTGPVEADETYVGGKPRYGAPKQTGRRDAKKPVVVLVERNGGKAHATFMRDVTDINMRQEMQKVIDKNATIFTDQSVVYTSTKNHFAGHHTVNHHAKEYARHEPGFVVHSNTAESFFALLKRGHYGTFHHISEKHIQRYCNEFAFRWSNRKVSDAERTKEAIRGAEGKRLMYK